MRDNHNLVTLESFQQLGPSHEVIIACFAYEFEQQPIHSKIKDD